MDSDGQAKFTQTREHFILESVGYDHYTYTGIITVSDASRPAKMKFKYPMNLASIDLTVFDTDYDNYAGILTCQNVLVGHRKCASILSRKPTLDKEMISQVRKRLSHEGVDPSDLNDVEQENCKDEEDDSIDLHTEDKGLSWRNIETAMKAINSAADLIKTFS